MKIDPKEVLAHLDALAAEGAPVADLQQLVDAYLRNVTAELWVAMATHLIDDKEFPLEDDTREALIAMREQVVTGEVVPGSPGRMH